MARCPPGVICIENMTIIIVCIVLAVCFLFFQIKINPAIMNTAEPTTQVSTNTPSPPQSKGLFPRPSYSISNISSDVLLNPYTAPVRDDRFVPSDSSDPRGIPINVATRGVGGNTPYRQIGLLTRINGPETMLPLMGRPLYSNRSKWQFYTISDKNNMLKLPVTNKGKSCTSEYGCDDLSNGDSVFVEGYNDAFKVTMYENNVLQYIPY
jgi:hypothetical protein